MSRRSSVSIDALIERDGPGCMWPGCRMRATEKAHFHSKGMGGTPDGRRDTIDNQGGMCFRHARISDGLQPNGWPDRKQALQALLGSDFEERIPVDRWAYETAEALKARITAR